LVLRPKNLKTFLVLRPQFSNP